MASAITDDRQRVKHRPGVHGLGTITQINDRDGIATVAWDDGATDSHRWEHLKPVRAR